MKEEEKEQGKKGKEDRGDRKREGRQVDRKRTMWQMASKDIHKAAVILQKILFSGIFLQ